MKLSLKLVTFWVTKQTSADTKIGITHCILSDHHGLKLEFNNTNIRKAYKLMEIKQCSIQPQQGQGRNKEIKEFLEYAENRGTTCPNI